VGQSSMLRAVLENLSKVKAAARSSSAEEVRG
jgi:hypothetical protein